LNKDGIEFNFIPIAMQQIALDIFIDLHYKRYPFETIEFLVDNFELLSECDTSSGDNDVFNCEEPF
jgi:hypothetical protein